MADIVDQILSCEKTLLKGNNLDTLEDITPLLISLQRGEYNVLVESNLCKTIFCDYKCKLDNDNLVDQLCSCLNDYLSQCAGDAVKELEVLCIGIASLQGFVQSNWTGPAYTTSNQESACANDLLLNFIQPDQHVDIVERFRQELSVDGEEISASITHPELLILAIAFFNTHLPSLNSTEWWLMRAQYIHQQILDEHSPTLQGELIKLSQILQSSLFILNERYLETLLHLEIARIYLHYGKVSISEQEIKSALNLLSMEVNLSGALGRRTQYQKRDFAQLTMNVKIGSEAAIDDCSAPVAQFPKDVLLNDDVRLPHIAFSNTEDGQYPDLSPLQQAVIIAVFVQRKKSQAKDNLMNEELTPFLNCLLAHPKVWPFQLAALLFRSRLECEHKRTVERALMQTQELIDLNSNTTSLAQRMHLFYCSYCPPTFVITSECASILVSLGSVQSALSLYLKLQMWDEVIDCYNYLKLRHMAAEVIRERMKKAGETVKLWCYLGDATDDTACYQKAWELSGARSAQAQRHWALYHFRRKQFIESIEHFKMSLSINSLQVALWFRLGYATLITEQWAESAQAYRRYCSLEPESFEAWNNLAKAYILQGQKQRAYSALQEAVKCNYETWQVWDNLMAVSSDCGYFEEVIHCYHRILDLKDKHIDEQILTVLTSVMKSVQDSTGKTSSEQKKKALELFGRITAKVMNNPTIWKLYAELTASIEDQTSITRSKTLQYYQKAYTAAMQDSSWFKEVKSIKQVIRICQCLGKAHLQVIKDCGTPQEAYQTLSSAKLSLQNIIAKIELHTVDFNKDHLDEKFLSEMSLLKSLLDAIIEEHSKLKSAAT